MVVKAYCDRCREEIEEWNAERNGLAVHYPDRMNIAYWDLCEKCTAEVIDQISAMVEGWKNGS